MLEQHRSHGRHDALLALHSGEQRDGEGWMVSYLDIMTLLVALFVLLLTVSGNASSLAGMLDKGTPASSTAQPAVMLPALSDDAVQAAIDAARALPVTQPVEINETAIAAAVGVTSRPKLTPQAEAAAIAVTTHAVQVPELTPQAEAAAIAVASPMQAMAISDAAIEAALAVARPLVDPQAIAAAIAIDKAVEEAKALPAIEGVEVSRIEQGISLRIQDHLLFDSADAALTNEGRQVIQRLVTMLNELEGTISVEGHSDSRPISTPRFPSNWELSSMRATSILRYLSEAGVDASRMRAIGYADTRPIASNVSVAGRAANRRVEVVVQTQ